VLQCFAVFDIVNSAARYHGIWCVAVCCSVLQCVAVCWWMSQPSWMSHVTRCVAVCCVWYSRCVAVGCSVIQCVAVCCSVLQCVAVCCSVLMNESDVMKESCHTYKCGMNVLCKCHEWVRCAGKRMNVWWMCQMWFISQTSWMSNTTRINALWMCNDVRGDVWMCQTSWMSQMWWMSQMSWMRQIWWISHVTRKNVFWIC